MAYDLGESESSEIIDVVPFSLHIVNSLNYKILSIYPLKKNLKKKTENKEVETAIYKSKMCHAICANIQRFSHMCVR